MQIKYINADLLKNKMKSWINIIVFGLLVSACFFSCVNDNPGPDQSGKTERGYLSFQLYCNPVDNSVRATTDYGTAEERKISKVYMLLYERGGNTGKLVKRVEINATNTSGIFTGNDVIDKNGVPCTEHQFVMKAISVEKQDYQLIMLINPTSAILANAVENTSTVQDMRTAIANTQASDYITSDGMFMTNAGGVIQILETQLKATDEAAEASPVTVGVERILAKVFLYENKSAKLTEVLTGGTIENVNWGLCSVNKQTFLIRKQDKLKNGITELGFIQDRSQVYAEDPNFIGNKNIISDDQQRNNHFTILDPLSTTDFKPWNGYNEQVQYYQYLLENTVSVDEQNATDVDPLSYITHVVLKMVIKNPGKVITDADYYSFSYYNAQNKLEWRAFTHAQALEWFNGSYPADMPSSLHEALVEAQTQNGSPFKFEIINNVIPPAPAGYASVKTSKGQVTFHKGGLNIYRIPIMHFGTDGATAGSYGYFGVVRNNTYNIIINSINGPGTNTSNEGYISTEIIVNPWLERGWDENLKPIVP